MGYESMQIHQADTPTTPVTSAVIDLGRLSLAFGQVDRITCHPDGVTPESDTDHTVMLGLIACAFASAHLPRLNLGLVAQYALVHDLVEVYAGDTPTLRISNGGKADKARREHQAMDRIRVEFGYSLPWISDMIAEYEARTTPEARYVKALDKLLPKTTHPAPSPAARRAPRLPGRVEASVTNLLDRINAAVDGLCPCGALPADGSAYCSDDCRPTHIAEDTDQTGPGGMSRHGVATPMRWRPDLVTDLDDSDLIPVDAPRTGYTGRYNASVFQRRSNPDLLHLRLDDGYRSVGLDVAEVADEHGRVSFEAVERALTTWRRLERELANPSHTEPVDGDPWADVFTSIELADAIAAGIPPMSREEAMGRLRAAYEQVQARRRRERNPVTILNEIREYATQFPIAERAPGRLEMGWLVRQHLTEYATQPAVSPPGAPSIAAIFGVPVTVVDTMHPFAWRLVDSDGIQIEVGWIDPGTLPDRYTSTFET